MKIFDSWAGILDEQGFRDFAIAPVREIVDAREGCGSWRPHHRLRPRRWRTARRLCAGDGRRCVAVDWTLPLRQARALVPEPVALQGNLDPLRLKVGGKALDDGIDAILEAMAGRAHIFNLGHGITPDVPVEHVAQLVERVRAWRPC